MRVRAIKRRPLSPALAEHGVEIEDRQPARFEPGLHLLDRPENRREVVRAIQLFLARHQEDDEPATLPLDLGLQLFQRTKDNLAHVGDIGAVDALGEALLVAKRKEDGVTVREDEPLAPARAVKERFEALVAGL